jgi:putative transposase
MSNHIRRAIGSEGQYKIEIIRDFKKYTSVKIVRAIENNSRESRRELMLEVFRKEAEKSKKHLKYKFWQSEYHPVELTDNNRMEKCLDYIHENPVKAGIVLNAEDYVYSSANSYTGRQGFDVKFIE